MIKLIWNLILSLLVLYLLGLKQILNGFECRNSLGFYNIKISDRSLNEALKIVQKTKIEANL